MDNPTNVSSNPLDELIKRCLKIVSDATHQNDDTQNLPDNLIHKNP